MTRLVGDAYFLYSFGVKAESGMKEDAMKKGKKNLEVDPLSVLTFPQLLIKMTNLKIVPSKVVWGCLSYNYRTDSPLI